MLPFLCVALYIAVIEFSFGIDFKYILYIAGYALSFYYIVPQYVEHLDTFPIYRVSSGFKKKKKVVKSFT